MYNCLPIFLQALLKISIFTFFYGLYFVNGIKETWRKDDFVLSGGKRSSLSQNCFEGEGQLVLLIYVSQSAGCLCSRILWIISLSFPVLEACASKEICLHYSHTNVFQISHARPLVNVPEVKQKQKQSQCMPINIIANWKQHPQLAHQVLYQNARLVTGKKFKVLVIENTF